MNSHDIGALLNRLLPLVDEISKVATEMNVPHAATVQALTDFAIQLRDVVIESEEVETSGDESWIRATVASLQVKNAAIAQAIADS